MKAIKRTLVSGILLFCALAFAEQNRAEAQELTLRFEIHPVITGARPWDGTGLNSAQMDSEGAGMSWLGQVGLDQVNQRMAPPDPYICLVLTDQPKLQCDRQGTEKDTLKITKAIPAEIIDRPWFGVVLVDSDALNLIGAFDGDDLIGYGVVLDEPTLAAVRAGDAEARRTAARAEEVVTEAVRATFGLNRSLLGPAGGGRLDAAKLSVSKCEFGCAMGESTIFITPEVDGW